MKDDRYILLAHKSATGQLSASEKKELTDWIAQSPNNKAFIDDIVSVWNAEDNNTIFPSPTANHQQQQWEQLHQKLQQVEPGTLKQNYLALKWASAIAACLCLAVGAWLIIRTHTSTSQRVTATTNLEVTLSDSSRMNLRKHTQLKIYEGQTRHIQLTGEAWLNITSNKSKPFKIELPGAIIRTTGGQVYIKSDNDNQGEITLLTGNATVNINGTNVILKEKQKFIVRG